MLVLFVYQSFFDEACHETDTLDKLRYCPKIFLISQNGSFFFCFQTENDIL